LRRWLSFHGFPLQPLRQVSIAAILGVPGNGVSVVMIQRFEQEVKILIRKLKGHIATIDAYIASRVFTTT
jgi:hypothetical protein